MRTIIRGSTTIVEDHKIDPNSNRLDQIDISDGTTNTTREFDYDDVGNITEEKRGGAVHMTPHYDATNRMDSVSP
jgi:hypothetical protein